MSRFLLIIATLVLCTATNYLDHDCDDTKCLAIQAWYAHVQQPQYTTPCCGEADAYWADEAEVVGDDYVVTITDARVVPKRPDLNGRKVVVPPERVDPKHQGNPTGHTIIFMRPDGWVYCFFPNSGV